MISEPTVEVWAATSITGVLLDHVGIDDSDDEPVVIELLHEAAGRACYDSFDRPNPATATTRDYVANILKLEHYSVLAHGHLTLYITGISRSLAMELIRSRFLAFSMLSQRYVDSSEMDWVCPPLWLDDLLSEASRRSLIDTAESSFQFELMNYRDAVAVVEEELAASGMSARIARKKAREAARAVLPEMTETRMVVSGNIRAWRDFVSQRWSDQADAEIDRLAGRIAEVLRSLAPYSTADLGRDE